MFSRVRRILTYPFRRTARALAKPPSEPSQPSPPSPPAMPPSPTLKAKWRNLPELSLPSPSDSIFAIGPDSSISSPDSSCLTPPLPDPPFIELPLEDALAKLSSLEHRLTLASFSHDNHILAASTALMNIRIIEGADEERRAFEFLDGVDDCVGIFRDFYSGAISADDVPGYGLRSGVSGGVSFVGDAEVDAFLETLSVWMKDDSCSAAFWVWVAAELAVVDAKANLADLVREVRRMRRFVEQEEGGLWGENWEEGLLEFMEDGCRG